MKKTLLSIVAALAALPALAQEGPLYTYQENIKHPAVRYDSLLAVWNREKIDISQDLFFREFINIDVTAGYNDPNNIPDSVYEERFRMMMTPLNMPYNDLVKPYIIRYTSTSKGMVSRILGQAQYYMPYFEAELARQGMPLELKILPLIESALVPTAISRAGAGGLWQFMPATGRAFGLEITSFEDDRFDVQLATEAACKYLKRLYGMFDDWTLALAAYNCGEGNVAKALVRAGDKAKTFWDIYPYLPAETRGYVPGFIGMSYAYMYHKAHNINPITPSMPLAVDTVMVSRFMHFGQVSSTLGIPVEVIRELNPQYLLDIVPVIDPAKPRKLVLPQAEVVSFVRCENDIYCKDTVYLAKYLSPDGSGKINLEATAAAVTSTASKTHKIKSGDTLGGIAAKYGTTVKRLAALNGISNPDRYVLRIGKTLKVN